MNVQISLDWMLGCFRRYYSKRRTIVNLIPLRFVLSTPKDMEEVERYEDCVTIKSVIEEIYEQKSEPNNMKKKKQKEIISLLEITISKENEKKRVVVTRYYKCVGKKKLQSVKEWKPKKK